MQEIGSSSCAAPQRRRLGAFEKSVIVKWRPVRGQTPKSLSFATFVFLLLTLNFTVAPSQGANIGEDLAATISDQFSHLASAFSPSENTDSSHLAAHSQQDNELGKTLATSFPLGSTTTSVQPVEEAHQRTGSGRPEESPGNFGKSDHTTSDLHVIDFGDHAEPSELATLLTLGGGGGGGGSENQTVVGGSATKQPEKNYLLKTNNDGNRTSGLAAEPTHLQPADEQNNNQANQQVRAGRPLQNSQQLIDAQQPQLLNIKHSSGDGKQERRWSKKNGKKKKRRKRKKFPSSQQQDLNSQQQQNATASLPPSHQMITYVSRDHQLLQPAHQFEQLLSPSQPLARFLQPSAFKLALNSPMLYRQLHLNERHQPLEFGRYYLHSNSNSSQLVASEAPTRSLSQMVGGPFELEQLQATASTRQNKKVQHSMFSHDQGDGGDETKGHAREPSSQQQQLLQTHESSKSLEHVNAGELATPTSGQPPAISDHLDDQEDGGGGGGGGELNLPNSPQLDYETDEISGGGELFSSEQHLGEDSWPPANGGHAAMSSKRQVDGRLQTSNQQVGADETGSGGNKTAQQVKDADEEAADGRQVAAQSKSSPTTIQVAQQQQQQQQRPGLKMANNELLVGPFKSEAEAPATITLAGVVYQKSGSSSALLRAAPVTNGKQVATTDNNLDLSLALVPAGQLRSERAGSSTTIAQSSVAPTAAAAAAAATATASSDWSQSMMLHNNNNMIKSQPQTLGSSVYLGTISQQSPMQNFGLQNSGDLNMTGEQMSLSSSSAKPTTSSSKSLASQLMGSNGAGGGGELVIATGSSAASLLGASQPDLGYATSQQQVPATAQLYQQRLPNGSIIWTLNKPGLAGGGAGNSLSSLMQVAASNDASSSSSSSSIGGGGGSPFEVGVASSEPSESKHHHHHKAQGGPIVIVQKDVKPVKYHLLRAYLKLRRLLRPFEATYVFPGDHAPATSTSSAAYGGSAAVLGASGGVQVGSNAFLRRRQPGLLPNLHVTRGAPRRWRARRFLGGGGGATTTGGRLER